MYRKDRKKPQDVDYRLTESMQKLLFRGAGSTVQVIYVNLADGREHVFLGTPLSDNDYNQIAYVSFGEIFDPVVFSAMAEVLSKEITAH